MPQTMTIWKTTFAVLLPIGHKCWKKSSKIGRQIGLHPSQPYPMPEIIFKIGSQKPVVEDLDGTVESTDTIVKLKTKIENSSTFESAPDFVKTLIQNCIDERGYRETQREATLEKQKIELAKLQLYNSPLVSMKKKKSDDTAADSNLQSGWPDIVSNGYRQLHAVFARRRSKSKHELKLWDF
ncbi:hypothetical protein TNCV_3376921 [Trichonephila clavipes]|nr:hypothetical protein TNCV_3376921 [Trichonephila clavipes]